jgi:membrane protease YdiL (CAAX protease family)
MTLAVLSPARPSRAHHWHDAIKQHPLVAYFALAYVGCWILVIPLVFSQRGLGLITVPDPLALALFLLPAYTGPFFAAVLVTGVTGGRAAVQTLMRRIVQWRVDLRWYLLALVGYPLVFAIGYLPTLGTAPLTAIIQKWPLLLTVYLPTGVVSIFFFGSLGEETGWRGFALPRLQVRYGPILGTLILGALHALWHLPVYFIPGAILPGAFDPTMFVANSLAILAETIIWTWIFNNARGSILIATLVHGLSNANSSYFPQLVPLPGDPWATFKIVGVCAVVLLAATRGRLGDPAPAGRSVAGEVL